MVETLMVANYMWRNKNAEANVVLGNQTRDLGFLKSEEIEILKIQLKKLLHSKILFL